MSINLLAQLLVGPDDNGIICIIPVLAYDRKVYLAQVFRILEYGVSSYFQYFPLGTINNICICCVEVRLSLDYQYLLLLYGGCQHLLKFYHSIFHLPSPISYYHNLFSIFGNVVSFLWWCVFY